MVIALWLGSCNPYDLLVHDRFEQADFNSEVDILWVVDNSNSMANVQEAVKANFADFIAEFANVDNFSGGGMYTILDDEGVARHPAFDEFGGVFSAHPLTGASILGFQVPQWDAVGRLADSLAREVPEIPYVGWDIAITPEGPVVVEGNYNTGVFQLKPTATGVRTGLLPVYREAIGF